MVEKTLLEVRKEATAKALEAGYNVDVDAIFWFNKRNSHGYYEVSVPLIPEINSGASFKLDMIINIYKEEGCKSIW